MLGTKDNNGERDDFTYYLFADLSMFISPDSIFFLELLSQYI